MSGSQRGKAEGKLTVAAYPTFRKPVPPSRTVRLLLVVARGVFGAQIVPIGGSAMVARFRRCLIVVQSCLRRGGGVDVVYEVGGGDHVCTTAGQVNCKGGSMSGVSL